MPTGKRLKGTTLTFSNMKKRKNTIKLKEVTIRGYKSISYNHAVSLKLGCTNILIGSNGGGKSNIISFFRMLSYMMSRSFEVYVEMAGTANSLLHYGSKKTPAISAELKFADNSSEDIYQFTLSKASPDRLIITEESVCWTKNGENEPFRQVFIPNFKESALVDSQNKSVRAIYNMLSFCKVYQFHDSSEDGPLRQTCPIETANYLQSKGNNLPSFLLFLKKHYEESYQRIIDYVSDVIPQFQDFYLEPVGKNISLRWKDKSATDYIFNSDQLSDGSIRFVALATLLLQPEDTIPSVIIIDEPELGLHPYAVSQLSEMIKEASIHCQVIVASQSKDLVDCFDIDNISIVEMDEGNKCTTITRLNQEDYKLWMEHYSISELWDKNIIGGRPV